jgi:hypothetical protein
VDRLDPNCSVILSERDDLGKRIRKVNVYHNRLYKGRAISVITPPWGQCAFSIVPN